MAPDGPPLGEHAESVHLRALSMEDLQVDAGLVRALHGPVDLRIGNARIRLRGGFVTPVYSGHFADAWEEEGRKFLEAARRDGEQLRLPTAEERGDRELVGVVWSGGEGTVDVVLADRADGLRLANRVVGGLGGDPGPWAEVAHRRAPMRTSVTEAILLGVDPLYDTLLVGPDLSVDPYEVVVYGDGLGAAEAARRAEARFAERAELWDDLQLDVGKRIAWDRLGVEAGAPPTGQFSFADLNTDTRYGLVVAPGSPVVDLARDRWLTVVRDLDRSHDPRRTVSVESIGYGPGGYGVVGLVGGVPAPEPPGSPLRSAKVRAFAEPHPSGGWLVVRAEARLTVAADRSLGWIDVTLPRVEKVPGTWSVSQVSLADGTPLLGRWTETPEEAVRRRARKKRRRDDGSEDEDDEEVEELEVPRTHRLVFPAPLAPGEEAELVVRWSDTWPLANRLSLSVDSTPLDLGSTSGLQALVPAVGDAVGRPLRGASGPGSPGVVAVVGVPASGKVSAVVSGVETRRWEEGGWSLVEATCPAPCRWHSTAIGRFEVAESPAVPGFPAVHTRLLSSHYGAIDDFGPETRRVVQFYERWLPEFPVSELSVFEGPSGFNGFVWVAPSHLVSLSTTRTMGTVQVSSYWNPRWDGPHLESGVFAHELAHQYFGHLAPPATSEDFWIAESLSELFACLYVAAAFGGEDCAVRMKAARDAFEQDRVTDGWRGAASLTSAYSSARQPQIVYKYGPYLLEHVLRPKIGREAFYGALDGLLRAEPWAPLTTERLREAFEETSGQDLRPFFDSWVSGGFVPALSLVWERAEGHVRGRVTSDVPFGEIEVPVRVSTDAGAVDVVVRVVDGAGIFEADPPGMGAVTVDLDPERRVVARARRVTEQR